jgi:hypothetical protein
MNSTAIKLLQSRTGVKVLYSATKTPFKTLEDLIFTAFKGSSRKIKNGWIQSLIAFMTKISSNQCRDGKVRALNSDFPLICYLTTTMAVHGKWGFGWQKNLHPSFKIHTFISQEMSTATNT